MILPFIWTTSWGGTTLCTNYCITNYIFIIRNNQYHVFLHYLIWWGIYYSKHLSHKVVNEIVYTVVVKVTPLEMFEEIIINYSAYKTKQWIIIKTNSPHVHLKNKCSRKFCIYQIEHYNKLWTQFQIKVIIFHVIVTKYVLCHN